MLMMAYPHSYLKRLEHMRERFHANEEVADNHGGAEVRAIVEGWFADALQVGIS